MKPIFVSLLLIVTMGLPRELHAAEPSLDETLRWITTRLSGLTVDSNPIKASKAEGEYLVIDYSFWHPYFMKDFLWRSRIPLSSLDGNAEIKEEGGKVTLTLVVSGERPITSHNVDRNGAPVESRKAIIGNFANVDAAQRMKRAFDHATKLAGGGKELF